MFFVFIIVCENDGCSKNNNMHTHMEREREYIVSIKMRTCFCIERLYSQMCGCVLLNEAALLCYCHRCCWCVPFFSQCQCWYLFFVFEVVSFSCRFSSKFFRSDVQQPQTIQHPQQSTYSARKYNVGNKIKCQCIRILS